MLEPLVRVTIRIPKARAPNIGSPRMKFCDNRLLKYLNEIKFRQTFKNKNLSLENESWRHRNVVQNSSLIFILKY